MKLRVFRADKGDCLLLESSDGKLMLVDGGMSTSMKKHVAPHLAELRDDGRTLEAIYVSHIDQDHISGVLSLLNAELDWRVFDANAARGDPSKRPAFPRPPEIKSVWHNAFRDQVDENVGRISSQIAASVPILLATQNAALTEAGLALRGIAASVEEALKVSNLLKEEVLDIPLNKIPGNTQRPKLLRAGAFDPFDIGTMTFTIVGPTDKELEQLREGWNNWLEANQEKVKKIRDEMEDNAGSIAAWEGVKDFKGVTTPNIASLTFMVEENGKRLLLTGDTQHDILMDGLRQAGYLEGEGPLHIDVLKVQHHGAVANLDEVFAKTVTADQYVFCGDGAHDNPEIEVLKRIFNARMEFDDLPFTFLFNTNATKSPQTTRAVSFANMAKEASKLRKKSKGRLTLVYNDDDFVDIEL